MSLLQWNTKKRARLPKNDPYTEEQVRLHSSEEDAWCVFEGKVYDVTDFLKFHPGGTQVLTEHLGKDVSEAFYGEHSWVNFFALLTECQVGYLINN